jgi:anti-sigma factor (TIGR02949 family)
VPRPWARDAWEEILNSTRYTCEEVFRRLADFVDRELSAQEIVHVEEHLAACEQCAHEYAFELSVIQEIKSAMRRIKVPGTLRDKVRRLLDSLEADDTGA